MFIFSSGGSVLFDLVVVAMFLIVPAMMFRAFVRSSRRWTSCDADDFVPRSPPRAGRPTMAVACSNPQCGNVNRPNARFCSRCGRRLLST